MATTHAPKTGIKEVDNYDELVNLVKTTRVVVIDFFATWCGPCKMISPAFAEIGEKLSAGKSDVIFIKVDVDKVPESDVNCMPTFKVYKDGKLVDKMEGAPSPAQLEAWIAKHLK